MSPMLDIQRRHAEVFRLRFGDKGDKGQPRKLTDSIRVTAGGRAIVDAFTAIYGGTVRPWSSPKGEQWEAYLPTTEIAIMVLPGQSISQWWELYKGSVCQRRCDSETETKSGKACLCPERDPVLRTEAKGQCSPTTRVNVLCPDVEVVGAGVFVAHGIIAAETLPQSIAIAEAALARGVMVPATLRIVEHRGLNHFIVPQIEIVGVSLQTLATGELPSVTGTAITSPSAGFTPVPAALEQSPAPPIAQQIASAHEPKQTRSRANSQQAISPTGVAPRTVAEMSGVDTTVITPDDGEMAGEPASASPGSPAPPDEGPSLPLASRIAMWCSDAGIATDIERHAFLCAFSEGRYRSAKEVPSGDVLRLRSTLVHIKRGELALQMPDRPDGMPTLIETPATSTVTAASDEREPEPFPDYKTMRVGALATACRERGLDDGGTKAELIGRLETVTA